MQTTFFNDPESEAWDRAMKEADKAFWRAFYTNCPEMRDLVKQEWIE